MNSEIFMIHLAGFSLFLHSKTYIMAKEQQILNNRRWLLDKANEPGVEEVAKGIYRKALNRSNGSVPSPNRNSVVVMHYTGSLINGKKFDSSRGGAPMAVRLRELIPGLVIAMQQMHVGDRWEIYIPAEMGYGKRSVPGIPGGSTLIFDVELKSIG